MTQLKFIEVNYHCHHEYSDPADVIQKHGPSNRFAEELSVVANITLVKHINYDGAVNRNNIHYKFFRRKNSFWQIPFPTHRFIAGEQPEVVLVQGFIFPLQVIHLRKKLGKKCILLLQHHGEIPFRRKRIFQKMADRMVDGYLFSSLDLAIPWLDSGIIKQQFKCFELPPASFDFTRKNKEACRSVTGMGDGINFLWVGRLNANKDPLTVLAGFEKYFSLQSDAKLYMIHQENDLLEEVKSTICKSATLNERIVLVGKVERSGMEAWYTAADCFVSGSRHEGGSYALMEAIACGCVPVVTNIPAAVKTTDNGRLGYIFEAGNEKSLFAVLSSVNKEVLETKSAACIEHYKKEYSPVAVARKMMDIIQTLQSK